ncbi:MAG: hypothetical protein WCK63_08725 [Betaproteobacteria bacterium]
MSARNPPSARAAELRQDAEAAFRESAALSPEDLAELSPEAIGRMVHELHVHQIELEMQNEELRLSQLALEAARLVIWISISWLRWAIARSANRG